MKKSARLADSPAVLAGFMDRYGVIAIYILIQKCKSNHYLKLLNTYIIDQIFYFIEIIHSNTMYIVLQLSQVKFRLNN